MFYVPKFKLQTKEKKAPKKKSTSKTVYDCNKCGLNGSKFEFYGDPDSKLMIIGNKPDQECEKTGIPFTDEKSQTIRNFFLKHKMKFKSLAVTFAVSCHYKKKSDTYAKCCRSRMVEVINEVKPNLIIAMGDVATISILNVYGEKLSIGKLRGRLIPCYEFNCLVFPVFAIEDIYEFIKDDETGTWKYKTNYANKQSLEWDLERIIRLWNKKYYKVTEVKSILKERDIISNSERRQITTVKELQEVLKVARETGKFSYDYEASNAKPYDSYFKVYYIGIGIKKNGKLIGNCIYSNEFDDIETAKKLIEEALNDPSIQKLIQGAKFEELCSRIWFKRPQQQVIQNSFCTLIATHIVDERQGCKNLDFQNLVRNGLRPYDGDIHKYLIKENKDDKCNTIHLAPKDKMIDYNGLDVITTYVQAETLQSVLLPQAPGYKWCYDLLYEGDMSFADIQEIGINIDQERLDEIDKLLIGKLDDIVNQIIHLPSIKDFFKREISKDEFETFLKSPQQLQDYLYNHQKITPTKKTKKGFSTDEETLNLIAKKYGEPLCTELIPFRKLSKAKSTYVDDMKRNICEDGRLHYSFLIFGAASYRPSATDPNVLNFPKHDDIIPGIPWTLIREPLIPTIEYKIDKKNGDFIFAQADMSGFELFIGAGLSGDKKFIKDVNETDLHARESVRVFELPCDPSEVKKREFIFDGISYKGGKIIRFETKNNCVFATVYGATPNSIAKNMRQVPAFMSFAKDKYNQLKPSEKFETWVIGWSEEHIRHWQQDQLFADYPRLKEFQDEVIEFYRQNGYIEYFMGFRNHHPMTRNELINRPTQGCLVKSSKILTKIGLIPIGDLVGKQFKTWTGFKWANATAINRGKCQLAKIELESGLVINCDTRHILKNHQNDWIDFNKLKIGDYISLPRIQIEKRIEPRKEITWPFILGFIIGDGNFYEKQTKNKTKRYILDITGGEKKKPILSDIAYFFELKEGFNPCWSEVKPTENRKENRYHLTINNNLLKDIMNKFGMEPNKVAKTKRIPKSVWTMNQQDQMDFLNGLWLSDGNRSNKSLHLSNYELIKEIQILASSLHYDSFISPTKNGYELNFRQVERQGFEYKRKSNRNFPREAIEYFMKDKPKYKSKQNDCVSIVNKKALYSNGNIKQLVAERIIEELDPNYEIYRYDRITNIKVLDREEDTFTLMVDDSLHQFVADGVIHKNSAWLKLLYAINKIQRRIREEIKINKFRSRIVLSVYDDILFDAYKPELAEVICMTDQIMLEIPKDHQFDFARGLQLKNEWSFGYSFANMKEINY